MDALTKESGRYVANAGDRRFEADNVVVATGVFKRPYTPEFAGELDPGITQLHSSDYRNLSQLQDGPVLVVGASHSGSDIAYEASASHDVVLSGTDTGQIPVPIESRRGRMGFRVLVFVGTHVLNVDTPMGRKMRPHVRHGGGPLLRYRKKDLLAAGVERVSRARSASSAACPCSTTAASSTCATSSGAPASGPTSAGSAFPFEIGDDGYPVQYRGAVASSPGLYFAGLPFLHSFASMLVAGAGRDAERVARHIARSARRSSRHRRTSSRCNRIVTEDVLVWNGRVAAAAPTKREASVAPDLK